MNEEEDEYCWDEACYDNEGEECEEEKVDEDEEYELDDILPISFNRLKSQSSMIFLRFDEIKKVLDLKIAELQELLEINYDKALVLYHYFHWNRDKLENSEWFMNQEEISRKAGLLTNSKKTDQQQQQQIGEQTCPICLGEYSTKEFDSLKCGHRICVHCWEAFINDMVEVKENAFFWKCPGQSSGKNCNLIIPDSFNRKYLKKENDVKYMRKLCISYVEENKAFRWCPAPDCMYCIENPSLTARTIRCKCSTVFCFRCGLEDHQPCRCDIAVKWQNKNTQENENTKWINVFTKNCPKCQKPIEKNQGCNHITCKHIGCNLEFCWLCLDEWSSHQGSHYKCNKYEALNEEEKNSIETTQKKAKSDLEKYVFYFERFSNSERAYQIGKELYHKMENNVTEMYNKLNLPYGETLFLTEAAETLYKIRKTLQWTYAFAYFIDNEPQKNLFEFHQKDLERYCEELNEALEIKYSKSVQMKQGVLDLKSFLAYKDSVTNVCLKCQKFSKELIHSIESDFQNIEA